MYESMSINASWKDTLLKTYAASRQYNGHHDETARTQTDRSKKRLNSVT
jgi:hypothetical protein